MKPSEIIKQLSEHLWAKLEEHDDVLVEDPNWNAITTRTIIVNWLLDNNVIIKSVD